MKQILRIIILLGPLMLFLSVTGFAAPITLIDNTSGQLTWNAHQLEATGGSSGAFSEDVSSSSYNLQSSAPGYRLSGRLQIGGMTAYNDGDTSWAEVNISSVVPSIDTTFGWDTGVNLVFAGSSTSGTAGYGYEFWLREATSNLGTFNTNNVVRSNLESETGFPPDPRSVFFDFALTVVPSGSAGGTAYLDVSYGGSTIGSLSGAYAADLSSAYVYVGLYDGETGENEFGFLDYSSGGTEGQLDLTAVPIPPSMLLLASGLLGLIGIRRMRKS